MAKYRVIKAHDGLEAGTVKVLAPCPIAAEMVRLGYWEEVPEEKPKVKPAAPKKAKKK